MKYIGLKLSIFVAFLIIPLSFVVAAPQTGNVHVATDEIMSGNLYVAGESVLIEGTISGDLIAVAQTIRITGRIEGDIIAAAQEVIIEGSVGGNVRIAGEMLRIDGAVARNVNAFGANIILGTESRVGWDVYLAGTSAESRGVIDGSLSGHAGWALLAGSVGKNVDLTLDSASSRTALTIEPTALINGDLKYTSSQAAIISSEAEISGEVRQLQPVAKAENNTALWLWKTIFSIFAALVVGLALIFLGRNTTSKIIDGLESAPLKSFVPGILLLILMPAASLVLVVTVIGLPLALITVALWLILIYVGKVLAAILLGRWILARLMKSSSENLLWPLVFGVIIVWLLSAIPYIGWLICLAASLLGLGGTWNYVYREREQQNI